MSAQIIYEKQDLRHLNWSLIRNSSGTAGSFLKAVDDTGSLKKYYKLSLYDSYKGVIGHECVNELIVDRLLNLLGVEHLHYDLIHGTIVVDGKEFDTYLCASNDFKKKGEHKIALDAYYQAEKQENESPLDFCIRLGFGDYIYQMMVVDYLILNRDRHGANIEILRNSLNKTIRIAPFFDHGLSLLFSCYDEDEVDDFDVMKDRRVQSFIGTFSLNDNLSLIPSDKLKCVNCLKADDKYVLLDGLDNIVPAYLLDKIWNLIWSRWCFYEDLCNKR